MALFGKKQAQVSAATTPQAHPPPPDLRESIRSLSSAIETFLLGDLRDANVVMNVAYPLDAMLSPHHAPERSIWARSIPFAESAAAIGEWMIVVKLYALMRYWSDQALPQLDRSASLVQLLGWPRADDRLTLREKAFQAALRLDPTQVIDQATGETVGSYLQGESIDLGRTVDWLAHRIAAPPEPPSNRERMNTIIARARAGDADAIAFEKALAAETDEETRGFLQESASLGNVEAMEAAAEMACAAGDVRSATFWAETAATAGSVQGMRRLAAMYFGAGRVQDGIAWFERAGQAGDASSYSLLATMANEAGDHDSAKRWAQAGSLAGDAECMRLTASYLFHEGGIEAAPAAHAWLLEAVRRGSDRAMFQLGQLAEVVGNGGQAEYWFSHAAERGNADATQHLGSGSYAAAAPPVVTARLPQPAHSTVEAPLKIWFGQEADLQNPGQMIWSAQLNWPGHDQLEIRDRVAIDEVIRELESQGWQVVSTEPASGIQATEYTLRRTAT